MRPSASTCIHFRPAASTRIHFRSPASTCIHLRPPTSFCVLLRPPASLRPYKANFYRTQVNLGSDLWVRMSVSLRGLLNLTDVTPADDDTNPILTDDTNRASQGNVATRVTQFGGQLCKQYKRRHLKTKFWTNPSCATWWPNMQLIQVAPSGGQICN